MVGHRSETRKFVLGAALLAAVAVAGCQDATQPIAEMGNVTISVNLIGTPINTVTVTVTATNIPQPLVFNLDINPTTGLAQGTVQVPAGSQRTFKVQAFDSRAIETHAGTEVADVNPGANPTLRVALLPLPGEQNVTVNFGSFAVAVAQRVVALGRGQGVVLTAVITDSNGNPVSSPPTWGTTNPGRAAVSSSGNVTDGPSHGPVDIVASYAGVAAAATVQVLPPLAVGGIHACAIAQNDGVYCWGRNASGQLGDGSTTDSSVPVAVSSPMSFVSLSAGTEHTCAVNTPGFAQCWGLGIQGQLGDGAATSRSTPVQVPGFLFRTVSAGHFHTCGVNISEAAYCWGANTGGQLGDGTTTQRNNPVAVSGGLRFGVISAGGTHTCAVTTQGAAYCWGQNTSGQLGNGSTTSSSTPVAVSGSTTFVAISAGQSHTCAVAAGGQLYCWGANGGGQLGDGTTTQRLAPTAVTGATKYESVDAAEDHTCAVATNGAVLCWGQNANGRLGDGTTTARLQPTPIQSGLGFSAVGTGLSGSSCAITYTATAFCWGANGFGQLGDGTTLDRTAPVAVTGGLYFP